MLASFFKRSHALYHWQKGHTAIHGAFQDIRACAGSSASQYLFTHFRAYADILAIPPAQESPPWLPYNSAIPVVFLFALSGSSLLLTFCLHLSLSLAPLPFSLSTLLLLVSCPGPVCSESFPAPDSSRYLWLLSPSYLQQNPSP